MLRLQLRSGCRPTGRVMLILAALLIGGCGDSTTSPPSSKPDLRIRLFASGTAGNPANPLTFQAVVWNEGGGDVTYYQDCCHEPVIVGFLTLNGEQIYVDQPVFCRCPTVPYPLPPEPQIENFRFNGEAWESGEKIKVPTGRYAAYAFLDYRIEPDGPVVRIAEAVPFDWSGD